MNLINEICSISMTQQELAHSVALECIPNTMNKLYIKKEMAALGASLLLLLAVFLCRVDAQFSVNISCPSSGKKTLMSVSVLYFV